MATMRSAISRPSATTLSMSRTTSKVIPTATSSTPPSTIAMRAERCPSPVPTGFVNWSTEDETDLDYTPFPAAVRRNNEEAFQFTQEVRVASPAAAPVALSPDAAIKWQAGLFFFSQNYDQNAVNSLAPFTIPQLPLPLDQTSPLAELDDRGVGLYGQGTLTWNSNLDVTFAGRFDHERKQALLESFYTPPLIPGSVVDAEESFSNFSPQVSVAYRFQPDAMAYASVGSGYKAGGFNPASPPGSEGYDEEHTLNVEGGIKSTWAGGRVLANATLFFIDWSDLQLNLPNPFVPAQYYIANVDGASSRGIELELTARPTQGLDVFSSFGYARARFDDGTQSSGADVSGNRLPIAPEYTFNLGAQFSHALTNVAVAVRPRRADGLWIVPLRRSQPGGTGSVLARQLPRRPPQQARVRRGVDQERIRHEVRAAGVPLSRLGAVRLRWRGRQAANVRRQRWVDLLGSRVPRSSRGSASRTDLGTLEPGI